MRIPPPWLRLLLAAGVVALVVVLPFQPVTKPRPFPYTFEFDAASPVPAMAQLFYDVGQGFSEDHSAHVPVAVSPAHQTYRLPLASGTYRAFRLDPLDRAGSVSLTRLVIRGPGGRIIHAFRPQDVQPQNDIARLTTAGPVIHIETVPAGDDPNLHLLSPPVLELPEVARWRWDVYAPGVGLTTLALSGAVMAAQTLRRRRPQLDPAVRAFAAERPVLLVLLVAVAAVVGSTYPILFAGGSFVSPNYGSVLLYDAWPTLPGSNDRTEANVGGSDVGAIMWQHVPYSMLQHDALLRDFELPLWNRYNSTGLPLLGQGQSSFGDPLHLLPIAFRGAAWAWDLKYLLAKTLFVFGLGLLVWETTRHRVAAVLVTVGSAFIGFFLYRVNHPAFFSVSYAPWILYASWRIAIAANRRQLALAAAGLVVANVAELCSGTVKEAYMLLLALNFAGALVILLRREPWLLTARRLAAFTLAGLAFTGLSAPAWMTLWETLAVAYTSYNEPTAYQLPPGLLLGVFDEIFFRPFQIEHQVYNGSLNLLFLLGLGWFLLRMRTLLHDRFVLALVIAAVPPAVLAFGVVPPQWIVAVPFLRNVAHIDNSFLCVLFVLGCLLGGYGLREAWQRLATPAARADLGALAVLLALLAALYLGTMQAVQRSHRAFLFWGETFPGSSFARWYTLALLVGLALVLAAAWRGRQRGWTPPTALLGLLGLTLLCWRFGWHANAGWPDFVHSARDRASFSTPSPAVEAAHADRTAPARAVGVGGNLFPGWTAAIGVESISSPDALMSPYHREFVEATGLTRVWDWRIVITSDTVGEHRPIYDFLGVSYYFDRRIDQRLASTMEPVEAADLEVYRNPAAWPRAFFTDAVAEYETPAQFAALLRQQDGRPFAAMDRREARGSKAAPYRRPLAQRTVVPASDYALTTNRTAFTIEAPRAGLAVLQEAYWPGGFRATINGQPAPVLRLNHLFKGIVVSSAGTHRIEFTYRPHLFSLSLGAAAVGAALLLGLLFWGRRTEPLMNPSS